MLVKYVSCAQGARNIFSLSPVVFREKLYFHQEENCTKLSLFYIIKKDRKLTRGTFTSKIRKKLFVLRYLRDKRGLPFVKQNLEWNTRLFVSTFTQQFGGGLTSLTDTFVLLCIYYLYHTRQLRK